MRPGVAGPQGSSKGKQHSSHYGTQSSDWRDKSGGVSVQPDGAEMHAEDTNHSGLCEHPSMTVLQYDPSLHKEMEEEKARKSPGELLMNIVRGKITTNAIFQGIQIT